MKYSDYEIFNISVGDDLGLHHFDDVSILYAPLCDQIALVDRKDEDAIRRYLEKGDSIQPELKDWMDEMKASVIPQTIDAPDISQTTKMSLLPNLTCNFTCSYCYSAQGRSSTVISWEKAKVVLDYFINPNRIRPQHLSLFISGGGEPLISWDVTRKCIQYAVTRCREFGFTIHISVVTNGSMLNEQIVEFLHEYNCSVCISFEVLPHLQELQRRNYDLVNRNILLLHKFGVRIMLNSTITPASVAFMQEMVRAVIERYPFVAQYTMEPVTSVELFKTADALAAFYDTFYNEYLKAKQIAKTYSLPLRFTFDDSLRETTIRHCPGKFCITPQGTISICHLVSSPKESRYDHCIYGHIDETGVKIDYKRFKELYSVNLFSYERCQDCFAKFSCGGECMTRNTIYPASYMEQVCKFNRRFILHLLLERLEENVKQEYGLTLAEYVRAE